MSKNTMRFAPSRATGPMGCRGRIGGLGTRISVFFIFLPIVHTILPVSERAVLKLDSGCLKFSPDSSMLVPPSSGINARNQPGDPLGVWNVSNGQKRFDLGSVKIVRFSPDSRRLATYDWEGNLKIWDTATGTIRIAVKPPTSDGNWTDFCFTHGGRFIACEPFFDQEFVHLWSIQSSREVGRIPGSLGASYFPAELQTMESGPNNEALATFIRQDKIYRLCFWSVPKAGSPRCLQQLRIPGSDLALSPDLSTIATATTPEDLSKPIEIALWDRATGTKKCSVGFGTGHVSTHHFGFVANGKVLSVEGFDSSAKLGSRRKHALWRVGPELTALCTLNQLAHVSPDGNWLAVPEATGAELYDLANMQKRAVLAGKNDKLPSQWGSRFVWPLHDISDQYPNAFFSPDSRFVAIAGLNCPPFTRFLPSWLQSRIPVSSSESEVMRLWETQTGQQHAAFFGCLEASFTPDGKTLATVHGGGIVKLWDLPPRSRSRLIGLFLALLELMKGRRLYVEQDPPFGDIWVRAAEDSPC